jgi:serine/threonine-protein kinase
MAKNLDEQEKIIQFLRKRDYKMIKELGQGACGKTVLLHDDQIDERFVCKKYLPYAESQRQALFTNFIREIKLLHKIHHSNVVRVFNYYLYPEQFTGFILMEFVDGSEVDDYLARVPEQTNEVFIQAISGFAYLERSAILHRDIRPGNLMVREDGLVKIIDLGFGKEIRTSKDFEKSISLNWWCQPPKEFEDARYDFGTEVYFVGKLFEMIIEENKINYFKYSEILNRMCQRNPEIRVQSFTEIDKEIGSNKFVEIGFSEEELFQYRNFAGTLCSHVTKIHSGTKYNDDLTRIETQLDDVFRSSMLEEFLPDAVVVLRCFLNGTYYYKRTGLPVLYLKDFLHLLKASSEEKKRIILANLQTKLDAIPRYLEEAAPEEDVPF